MMARPAGARGSLPGVDERRRRRPARLAPIGLAGVAIVALIALWGLPALSAPPASPSPSPVAYSPSRPPGPSLPAGPGVSPTASPRPTLTAAGQHTPAPSATPSPLPSASPTRQPGAAPLTADEFDLEAQLVRIGFPLKPGTRYRYRNNWLDAREGAAEHYNHAHARRGGQLIRAHDGIDIYARRGEPVLAPFDGLVIDPATRWQPWETERYGLTAVVVSSEPLSEGYTAVLAHLDRLWVEPGQVVRRGEVLGTIGNTGNAEGGPAHLHFELRAPFLLNWLQLGEERLVDAFNPHVSLVAADPKRED